MNNTIGVSNSWLREHKLLTTVFSLVVAGGLLLFVVPTAEAASQNTKIRNPGSNETVSGIITLKAEFTGNTMAVPGRSDNAHVQFAVRKDSCAQSNKIVFGSVNGHNDSYTYDSSSGKFTADFDTTKVDDGTYCFNFNPHEVNTANPEKQAKVTFTVNNKPVKRIDNTNDSNEQYATLQQAITDPQTNGDDTIKLTHNLAPTNQIKIDKQITVKGNGHTLNFQSCSGGESGLLITANGVTVSNLVVKGDDPDMKDNNNGSCTNAIELYEASKVSLNNVSTLDALIGLNVNGSTVTVTNITTDNNEWAGIDVDQGSGVTTQSKLIVKGNSTQRELSYTSASGFADNTDDGITPHIFVDNASSTAVVKDVSDQYYSFNVGFRGGTATVYTLRSSNNNSNVNENNGSGGPILEPVNENNNENEFNENEEEMNEENNEENGGEVLGASTIDTEALLAQVRHELIERIRDILASRTQNNTYDMCAAWTFPEDLEIGESGIHVRRLQKFLNLNYTTQVGTGVVTGYYGPETEAAVSDFQRIYADGILAPIGLVSPTGYWGNQSRSQAEILCSGDDLNA